MADNMQGLVGRGASDGVIEGKKKGEFVTWEGDSEERGEGGS